jgi:DNA polymerase IV
LIPAVSVSTVAKGLCPPAPRTILHLDLDAFYASVEQLDRPELTGKPVLVGGRNGRGVVCACSYEARRYGVRSAMPVSQALRLCPAAILLPVRMARYQELSSQVFGIFSRYTDLIEPLSVDEAFLDVTGSRRLFGDGRRIAECIRAEVRSETGLAVSAGIAANKFLAKLASEQAKPDGLFVVPKDPDGFLLELPLQRLWGVGPVLLRQLNRQGLATVADLRRLERQTLERLFGTTGGRLYDLARGCDQRPVESGHAVKSVGCEDTFERDLLHRDDLRRVLLDLSDRVAARLRHKGLVGRTLTLKVRYADFTTVTRSTTSAKAMDHGPGLFQGALDLLHKTEADRRPVRLLGLTVSQLSQAGQEPMDLFDAGGSQRQAALDGAMDHLRRRFGRTGLCPATLLGGPESDSE